MDSVLPGSRWLHVKTGHIYEVSGQCLLESTCQTGILYRMADVGTGILWCRPVVEFLDGRFKKLQEIDNG